MRTRHGITLQERKCKGCKGQFWVMPSSLQLWCSWGCYTMYTNDKKIFHPIFRGRLPKENEYVSEIDSESVPRGTEESNGKFDCDPDWDGVR